jgi:hypothetical protein
MVRQPNRQEVAVRPFDPLIALLSEIPDPRRAEGKLYQLPYVLLFSILAVVTGGNSYRAIKTFIVVNLDRLNAAFGLCWKRTCAYRHSRHPPEPGSEGRRAGVPSACDGSSGRCD